MKEGLLYEKLAQGLVHCYLCSHHCRITEGKFGFCGLRQNIGGILYTHSYGRVIAVHADPIEKKPLYHFFPGSTSYSFACGGCNFRCGFCQNWEISQLQAQEACALTQNLTPAQEIVSAAVANSCSSISYTYTEPTIFFEYALEVAVLARNKGLGNVFVTNGYMSPECLETAAPYIDAANVDLKFFNEASYKRICAGTLKPVLDSITLMRQKGIWVEITTLLIPGENDSAGELKKTAMFIASLDPCMPWHISRFHPDYRFGDYQPTQEQSLKKAWEIAQEAGLKYVYIGNVPGWGNDTLCHNCGKMLVKREWFKVVSNNIQAGKCRYCLANIPGRFNGNAI